MTSYGKKLRIVYIGALVCIAMLSVASHLFLNSLEGGLANDFPIMNAAGKQRMLAQQIPNLAQQIYYDLARAEFVSAAESSTRLREAVEQWRATHRALVSRGGALGLHGSNSFEVAKALSLLDVHIESVSQAMMPLLDAVADPATLQGQTAIESVSDIIRNSDHFLLSMSGIVDAYETEMSSRAQSVQTVETTTTYLALAFLVFLAFVVFEPAIRRLMRQESDLLALRNAIDDHTIFSATDRRGRIVSVNDGFCEISGYSSGELVGATHAILNSGFHPSEFWAEMWETIQSGNNWRNEVCNRAKDGSLYWVDSTNIPQFDANGKLERFISLRFDITAKKAGGDCTSCCKQGTRGATC